MKLRTCLQVLRRLWSTLACLGLSSVHITGAARVWKAYWVCRALEPACVLAELTEGKQAPCVHEGANQTGLRGLHPGRADRRQAATGCACWRRGVNDCCLRAQEVTAWQG